MKVDPRRNFQLQNMSDDQDGSKLENQFKGIYSASKSVQKTAQRCIEVFKQCSKIGINLVFGTGLEVVGFGCLVLGEGANMKVAGVGSIFLGGLFLGDAYKQIKNWH